MELIKSLRQFYLNLHLQVKSINGIRLARRLVYLWVVINYAILSTEASYFYSPDSYIPKQDFESFTWFERIFNLLHANEVTPYFPLFLVMVLVFSVMAISEKLPRFSAFVVYFLMMNLDNRANVILDGGNNLMHLIAFYLIFVNPKKDQGPISKTITNLAVIMIKIQVTLVYATAGLLKVMGPLWNKGVALYYTMGVAEYGNQAVFEILSKFPLFLAFMTLGTVLFQVSLPYLIWSRQWRPYIIFAGTCLHLSISFVMGLFTFGFAMCVSYFFFSEDKEVTR